MAKGQPLPPGLPSQLRGLQRAGHSSNWAIELVSEVAPKALTSFVQNDIGCQQRP